MGWQGEIRKRSVLERIAARLGAHWQDLRVRRWRDNDAVHVWVKGEKWGRLQPFFTGRVQGRP